ncbi:YheC/YheD family protein [Tepidibacillus marianensis]|uniref:YheC/YheD family endospore coat-associated protein n=1 Tax=Tepidibacillus marianensis TaxID=3131995 RepID=UPI0030CFE80C
MKLISTKMKFILSENDQLFLSNKLITQLRLFPNQKITLYFGFHQMTVRIIEKNINQDQIAITSSVKNKLHIPYPKQILLKREEDGLRIGPIIGILTTDYSGKKFSNSRPFLQQHFDHFFKQLLKPAYSYPAYYFVFTPDQVNLRDKTVIGYFCSKNQKGEHWQSLSVPLPDVVYNRVPNRSSEKSLPVIQFKENYSRMGGKLFNQGFFNKWEMHQLLSTDQQIKKYFPETYSNPQLRTLEYMLNQYPLIYLKPSGGSLGLGIYKVKRENQHYLLSYRYQNTNKILPFRNLANLHKAVFKNTHKISNYLIQQGIPLIKYNDSPVDFRVHLHKNKKNEWQVVATGAKAAGKGSVTTHIRTGGKLLDAKQFIQMKFQSQANTIIEKMTHSAIEIAKVAEEKIGTPIGELGLDMGIDQQAQIWLFEMNSKPGRSIFKHPNLKQSSLLSTRYLLEYGIYLAGFY